MQKPKVDLLIDNAIELITGIEVRFGRRNHLDQGSIDRRNGRIVEQHRPRDSRGHLKMAQVVRGIEAVERTIPQLVEIQVVLLLWIIMSTEHEDAR